MNTKINTLRSLALAVAVAAAGLTGSAQAVPTDALIHYDFNAVSGTTVSDGATCTVSGIPICEDLVQVTYLLTFDEPINASTIDLADFESLGSGVSIGSVVSVQNTASPPAASVVITCNEVKYTFPSPLGSKNFARLKVTGQ